MTEEVTGTVRAETGAKLESERRMARGKEIASHPESIEKIGEAEWSVPSQTGFGRYKVWFVADLPRCTCPDFEARQAPCKHVYAVLDLRLKEGGQALAAPARSPASSTPSTQPTRRPRRGRCASSTRSCATS